MLQSSAFPLFGIRIAYLLRCRCGQLCKLGRSRRGCRGQSSPKKKPNMRHSQLSTYYGKPGLVAPCAWEVSSSGACPTCSLLFSPHLVAAGAPFSDQGCFAALAQAHKPNMLCGPTGPSDSDCAALLRKDLLRKHSSTATTLRSPARYIGRGLQPQDSLACLIMLTKQVFWIQTGFL